LNKKDRWGGGNKLICILFGNMFYKPMVLKTDCYGLYGQWGKDFSQKGWDQKFVPLKIISWPSCPRMVFVILTLNREPAKKE